VLIIEKTFVRTTMAPSYTEPVAKLLTCGAVEFGSSPRQWFDYRDLGLTEENIPDLIRMATDLDLHNAPHDSPEVWAPLHAWRALAQLQAMQAAGPLVHLFAHLEHDDWIPEELPKVFSMIGPETLPTLQGFLADDNVEESCRLSVPQCVVRMAEDHPDAREASIEVLVRQLQKFETNGPALNGFLITSLIDLDATPAIGLIREAFSKNQVDLNIVGDVEDVEMALGLRTSRSTPPPRLHHFGSALDLDSLAGLDDDSLPELPQRRAAKIGRNDPCPCGSGKKFKKCCLNKL
jgi:SEC-C motif